MAVKSARPQNVMETARLYSVLSVLYPITMMTSPNVAQNSITVHRADFLSVTIFSLIITGLVLYEWHNYSTLKITN